MSIRQLFLVSSLAVLALPPVFAQPTQATPSTQPARPIPPAQPANPAAADAGLGLAQALQAARSNLDVAIARGGLAAAQADIKAANRAPLPVLSGKFSSMDLQHGLGGGNVLSDKRIDKSVGLDWTWERGNKRALRTQGAQRAAEAAQADLEEVTAQQLLATHGAFFDLLAAQQRQEEVTALARSAEELADAARRRLRAGDLAAQEASRTEIEAERAAADAQAAQLERQRAALVLRQFVGPNVFGADMTVRSDWPALTPLPQGDDLTRLVDARPDVRAAKARVLAAQAALDNAQALKRSDVTVGASIDHYPGTSTRLLELRAQMPLQLGGGYYEGEIGRAQAQLNQAQDAQEKVQRLATAEMQRLQLEAQTSAQRAERYDREILPRARQVADGAELAYRKGAMGLTDLLDARRTLRATVLEALAARTDAAKALGAWQLRAQSDQFLNPTSSTESVK